MAKGTITPSESKVYSDYRTGRIIRQVTSHPSIHHQPFFMIPAYDNEMKRLYFISHRTGNPQIFAEIRSTGELLQMTEREDLEEWSIHPSHNGEYVYFTAGTGAWRIQTETLREELLVDFGRVHLRESGMIGAAMGTTSLSQDDRWWAVKYNLKDRACLIIIDTLTGEFNTILERDTISHMQFCPDDSNLLFYAGPLNDRVWIICRDGSGNRRLYNRNVEKKEWITHETWVPGRREIAMIDWPKGIKTVNVDTGVVKKVTSFNAWHAICNKDGTLMVADTNFPDIGLQLFNPLDGIGTPLILCYPESSSLGEHWDGPFPYENGPIKVFAPQHTHPHPSFSPDSKFVLYTSDRSGNSQIYEVEINS